MKISYDSNTTDEFITPCVLDNAEPIKKHDSVIFFNFRPDRAREITRALCDPAFNGFKRKNGFFPLNFVCMTSYDAKMPNVKVAFLPQSLDNTLGEYISKKQFDPNLE
jgi:2,3-bisphosphoglycerate-independent phosphoglycerate mutase